MTQRGRIPLNFDMELAEWMTYQWGILHRTLLSIEKESGRNASHDIVRFLGIKSPKHRDPHSRWDRPGRRLTVIGTERINLIRDLVANGAMGEGRKPDLVPNPYPYVRSHLARIIDPDEATSPRDVWLTFIPVGDFYFQEPIRSREER